MQESDFRAKRRVPAPAVLVARDNPILALYPHFVYNDRCRSSGRVLMASEHPKKKGQNVDGNSAPSALAFLQSLGAATGVLTGLAFISGWLYWSTYYAAFGLNPLTLNIPFSVVSVSLIQVPVRDWLSDPSWVMKVILFLAVFLAIPGLTIWFAHWYKEGHWGATAPAAILALGMLLGSWLLAFHHAMLDSGCQSRLAIITFEPIAPTDQAVPCQPGSTDICQLVLHINNAYHYNLAPDPDWCTTAVSGLPGLLGVPGATRNAYEISDAQVRIATIGHHIGW